MRMTGKKGFSIALAVWGSAVIAADSHGALVETDQFSPSQTAFDGNILNSDLIENGSAALSGMSTTGSVSSYPGDVAPYNSFSNLTDGAASISTTLNDISHDTYFDSAAFATGPSTTYTFSSPTGVTLTSINSISGWGNTPPFSHQAFNVLISLVGSPTTFVPLANVNYNPWATNTAGPGGANSSQVTITDSAGTIATGVAAIKFQFVSNGDGIQVFREIDVLGSATTPEPASVSILAIGAVGLLARRRKV